MSRTPCSSSWIVIADTNISADGTPAAHSATPGSAFPDRTFRSSDTMFVSSTNINRTEPARISSAANPPRVEAVKVETLPDDKRSYSAISPPLRGWRAPP